MNDGAVDLDLPTAADSARRIADGSLSPTALLQSYATNVARSDAGIGAWTVKALDDAGMTANEREAEACAGRLRGPLHGVPIAVKDVVSVARMVTTCGAEPFAHFTPKEDAVCVERLRRAGAVIMGKTTTTEFAYFEPSPTRNPWNLAHTPGGSSSGSAAAVASRMAPVALGTQTIGSVLRPAAFCGLVGFMATYDAVPRTGVYPFAGTLDHVGVIARCVEDARLMFGVMADVPVPVTTALRTSIAVVPELIDRADEETKLKIEETLDLLTSAGANLQRASMPPAFAGIHEAGRITLEAEFANGQREMFETHSESYRPRTRELIRAGIEQRSSTYVAAQEARALLRSEMKPIFARSRVLVLPTTFGPAPEGLEYTGDPWFCAPWSSIGVPAVSLPIGVGSAGLPLAIQLVAAPGDDAFLLDTAAWCENVIGFSEKPTFAKSSS